MLDQSPTQPKEPLVAGMRADEPDQNQPLTSVGFRSGLSQPSKLHLRPEVQMYLTLPVDMAWYTNCASASLSRLTRSWQCFLREERGFGSFFVYGECVSELRTLNINSIIGSALTILICCFNS